MSDYFDHVEHELRRAVRRHAHLPWYVRVRLRHSRALIVALTCIVIGGPALAAAAGVFRSGSPVAADVPPTPRANGGVAIPSTARVLALRFADPAGGPPWGLRLERTTRGLLCVQPGRVEFEKLGALGIDNALADDHRFHPFSDNYLDPAGCSIIDGHGHAFVAVTAGDVPASAIQGSCAPNYLSRSQGSVHEVAIGRGPICPQGALRDLVYGMLGPDAVSITYATATGRLVTVPTAGPDGAFLVVTDAAAHCPSHVFGTGRHRFVSTYCVGGTIGTDLAAGVSPVRAVGYRSGRICSLPRSPRAYGRAGCPSVGYVAPAAQPISTAQVAAPVRVRYSGPQYLCRTGRQVAPCATHPPPGSRRGPGPPYYYVVVSFTARIAVTSSDSYYQIAIQYPTRHTTKCQIGGSAGPTNRDLRAGQQVDYPDYIPQYCTGTFHVAVSYKQPRTAPIHVGQATFTLGPKRASHP